jgi:hypothetical protein
MTTCINCEQRNANGWFANGNVGPFCDRCSQLITSDPPRQLASLAHLVRIKALTCAQLAQQSEDGTSASRWNGLADELCDVVWMLGELAAGRTVRALNAQACGCHLRSTPDGGMDQMWCEKHAPPLG